MANASTDIVINNNILLAFLRETNAKGYTSVLGGFGDITSGGLYTVLVFLPKEGC